MCETAEGSRPGDEHENLPTTMLNGGNKVQTGNSTISKKRNPKPKNKAVRPTAGVSGGQGAGGEKSLRAEKA